MEKDIERAIESIQEAAGKWPSEILTRAEASRFAGGVYSVGYLANCDSNGTGPEGSFYIGRKKTYTVNNFAKWLIARITV